MLSHPPPVHRGRSCPLSQCRLQLLGSMANAKEKIVGGVSGEGRRQRYEVFGGDRCKGSRADNTGHVMKTHILSTSTHQKHLWIESVLSAVMCLVVACTHACPAAFQMLVGWRQKHAGHGSRERVREPVLRPVSSLKRFSPVYCMATERMRWRYVGRLSPNRRDTHLFLRRFS